MATYRGTEIAAGTDAQVAAQIAAIDSAKYQAPGAPAKIGVASLNQPAPAPAAVTTRRPATGTDNLAGVIGANADAFQANLDAKAKAAETSSSEALNALLKNSLGGQTESELRGDAYSQGGVDTAEAERDDINQQILAEQQGLQRATQNLDKNAAGYTTAGLADEKQRLTDASVARQADLSVIQLAKQGKFDSAKAIADRAVQAKFERQQLTNDALKFNYEQNKDLFDKADQRAFETAQSKREADLNFERQKEMARFEQTIKQNDPLYRAQLTKIGQEISAAANAGLPVDVSKVGDPTKPAVVNNTSTLTQLIRNSTLGQGTKTQIANVLGVVNASADLANQRTSGTFQGINPVNALLNAKLFADKDGKGGFGLPFRNQVKSAAQIENEGYLDAINLKVQQWASGASLTAQQIEQVNKFTPSRNDTDRAVRTKLNNLTNFMLTQAQSQLQSEGVDFIPAKVNLFETYDLYQQASPEQQKELRDAGLVK